MGKGTRHRERDPVAWDCREGLRPVLVDGDGCGGVGVGEGWVCGGLGGWGDGWC